MARTNWKDYGVPFENFTEEITYEWMKNGGFGREECKEWLDIGMKTTDAGFCGWLRNKKKFSPEWVLNYISKKDLKEKYEEYIRNSKLSEEVIRQIKDFSPYYSFDFDEMEQKENLTPEQRLLVDKLISNKDLKERYKKFGLCLQCNQPNTGENWCHSCSSKHLQAGFKNWTSGNQEIDEFIQMHQLKAINRNNLLIWTPYEEFANVEYLAKGGFGTVYKAKWNKFGIEDVVLKILHNSQNITAEFLQEIACHKLFTTDTLNIDDIGAIATCCGISQDPETKEYIMVMYYMPQGSLRQFLKDNYSKLNFGNKFAQSWSIVKGLNFIHQQGLVHRDFHSGNILSYGNNACFIADLGLSRPADEENKEKIFGVLPYVAPEVLRGQVYTQASDIYSFGIVAYEMFSGNPPYCDMPHDGFLAVKICQGLRPNLDDIFPKLQLLRDLISSCWDANPERRPTAREVSETFKDWYSGIGKNIGFDKQAKEARKAGEFDPPLSSASCSIHPQAVYYSRRLDYKNLSEPKNNEEFSKQFWNSKQNNIPQPAEFDLDGLDNMLENISISEGQKTEEKELQSHQETPPKK